VFGLLLFAVLETMKPVVCGKSISPFDQNLAFRLSMGYCSHWFGKTLHLKNKVFYKTFCHNIKTLERKLTVTLCKD